MGALAATMDEDGGATAAAFRASQATSAESFGQGHRLISAPMLLVSADVTARSRSCFLGGTRDVFAQGAAVPSCAGYLAAICFTRVRIV